MTCAEALWGWGGGWGWGDLDNKLLPTSAAIPAFISNMARLSVFFEKHKHNHFPVIFPDNLKMVLSESN